MKLRELVTDKVYKAVEKQTWMGRVVLLKFQEVRFEDGDTLVTGVNLATNLKCSMFADEWTFEELSPLELELL